jgi:hypothetical protein
VPGPFGDLGGGYTSVESDPGKRRGVRHRFISILALCACAVLAEARSFIAIAEWALDLTPLPRGELGIGRVPPCESSGRPVGRSVNGRARRLCGPGTNTVFVIS